MELTKRGQQLRHQWASVSKAVGTRAKNNDCDALMGDTLLISQTGVHCEQDIKTPFGPRD